MLLNMPEGGTGDRRRRERPVRSSSPSASSLSTSLSTTELCLDTWLVSLGARRTRGLPDTPESRLPRRDRERPPSLLRLVRLCAIRETLLGLIACPGPANIEPWSSSYILLYCDSRRARLLAAAALCMSMADAPSV